MPQQNRKHPSPGRRLAAILFADIAGYTSIMQKDEATARQMLDKFHFAINTKVDEHKGQVVNNYGDGCLCTFDSAVAAVQCAKELQEEFQVLPKVPVRIGLHSGDVFFEKDNVYGDSVNIASRIESMGIPSAVLFSKKIKDEIKNHPDLKIKSLGNFAFKNVEEEMEVFALANEGFVVPKREEMKGKLKDPKNSFFQKIWKKRIPQILAVYTLIAWIGLQLFDWALHQFSISPHWAQIFFITAIGIIPSLLVYLNNKDRINENRFTKKEKILFPTNLIVLGAVLFFMFRTADLGATSKNITFINADGIEETRNIIKEEFRFHVPIFSFDQIEEDSTSEFWGRGMPQCLLLDLEQNKYIDAHTGNIGNLSTTEKVRFARSYNGDFYVDGRYQILDGNFKITPTLRNSKNGNLVDERTFHGNDILSLIDSMSLYLKIAIGLSPQQIEESIDLDFKEFTTSNEEAAKEMFLFFNNYENIHLEKALELDTTFAGASHYLAIMYYKGFVSKSESKPLIDHSMRHRKKLPFLAQIRTMVYYHLIYEEYEKAEKLLEMQLEISPNDEGLQQALSEVYWQTGQIDKIIEQSEKIFAQNPKPSTGYRAVQAALMKGEPQEAISMIKKFLLLDRQNIFMLNLLADAYLHKGDYANAKETIEKIILIDPETETCISPLLDAVQYMESTSIDSDFLAKYEGMYRNSGQPQHSQVQELGGHLFTKFINSTGSFFYPAGEDTFVRVSPGFSQRQRYMTNDEGAIYAILNTNIRSSGESHFYLWKQDSTIWKAEELLQKKDYQKALSAYDLAIEKHPEHIYLQQYKEHVEFMLSKSKEDILKLYQKFPGEYGKISITIKNDQLMWKSPGLRESALLPFSDHQFLLNNFYIYLYEFEEKNGEIDAIQEYSFDAESTSWKKVEDWYFKKKIFLN